MAKVITILDNTDKKELQGQIADLENAFDIVERVNLLNPAELTIAPDPNIGGAVVNLGTTGPILVTPGVSYTYQCKNTYTGDRECSTDYSAVFYDDNNEFINGNYQVDPFSGYITAPDGAVYAIFTLENVDTAEDLAIVASEELVPYEPYIENTHTLKPESLPDGVSDGAVLYTEQTLTEEQKAQARANIGAVGDGIFDALFYEKANPYNVLNIDAVTSGAGMLPSGNLVTNTSLGYTDYIPVSAGEVLTYQYTSGTAGERAFYNIRYVCAFDASQKAVKSKGVDSTCNSYTVPEGIAYVRLSCQGILTLNKTAIVKSAELVPYVDYGATRYFNPEYHNPDDFKALLGLDDEPETFPLNLPEKLYALVGEELNIYFDNLVDSHDTDYQFDVTCTVGMQMERCYRLTATTAGSYPITIKATNRNGVSVEKTATIYVADTTAGNGKNTSVIVLGDSTTDTNDGTKTTSINKLNDNMGNDVMSVTTLGTRGASPKNHEGRSGWRFDMYFNTATNNPFYNPGTKTFDAAYYFANSGVAVPDWFFINLGINDIFNGADDEGAYTRIDTANNYCDSMIASLKAAAPNIKIGVVLTIPPNYSQDAFGKQYGCEQTRDRCKRNNALWVQNQIERYDGRENENIYLVPIYTNLDTKYNMTSEEIAVNKRNPDVKYSSPIGNGGVHPATTGYWQIADVYWFFLKNQA